MLKFFGKIARAMVLTVFVAAVSFAQSVTSDEGVLKDPRDGKTYKTVKIGDKVWMAENLNYDYNHGTAKSVCYKNSSQCEYGRLYTWAAAMDSAAVFFETGVGFGYERECRVFGNVRGV